MFKIISARLILTLSLILGINMFSKADVIRLVVKEELASCTGVAPMTCMQVKYKTSKDWELFYSQISGFKYEPGYRYTLLINRSKRKNVPADASAYVYTLKKVIHKQRVAKQNTAWDFVLKHKWKLIQMNGATQEESPVFMVFDKTNKRVNGKSGCNSFFGGYEKGDSAITFKHMAGTMMACSDKLNKLEHEFLTTIGDKTLKYDIADQTLNFYRNDKLVLMFGMAPLDK